MIIEKFGRTFEVHKWTGEKLGSLIGLDTETELIKSPGVVPDLVITTAYDGQHAYEITNYDLGHFLSTNIESKFILHNAPFDLDVIQKATGRNFTAQVMQGKILDSGLLYDLYYIGSRGFKKPRNGLDFAVKDILNETLPKDKEIRLTFGQYLREDGTVDYEGMSDAHRQYAVLDPIATYLLGEELLRRIETEIPTDTLQSHKIQLLGALALDQITKTGIAVDVPYVEGLRNTWEMEMAECSDTLAAYGLVRGLKGFQEKYEECMNFLEVELPRSPKTRKMSMKIEHLEPYRKHHFVAALLRYLELEKLKNFLKLLDKPRVFPRYDSVKNTLRTGSSRPNIQNPPRVGGVREAFVPDEGEIFIDIDYSSIELYALAKIMKQKFGESVLYDKLQEGADIHVYAASQIFDIPETEVAPEQRQIAKICNYGLAANMSAATFSGHMAKSGVDLDEKEAAKVKKKWANAFPEIKQFWKLGTRDNLFISTTGFVRANCNYTTFLNTHFQSIVAEGCKLALYFLQQEGFKIQAFIHDQVLIGAPKDKALEMMPVAQKIMEDAMEKVIPGMRILTEGKLLERYTK